MKTPKLATTPIVCLVFLCAAIMSAHAQDRKEDHEELRAMLRTATEAMNSRNIKALAPLMHEKFSITTVDQRLFTNLNEFEAYFNGLFGATLKSASFNPTADALTEFVGENIGLSHGTSSDTFVFADGESRHMNSRWTATLYKDNGKWKVLNIHIGTDLLDNPVVGALKSLLYKIGIGAGLAGLVLGIIIGRVSKRKS